MTVLNTLVYVLPFCALILSLLSWRFIPHKKQRLLAYVPLLIAFEVAALMNISFRNDLFDIFAGALILCMALELVWQLLKIRNRVWQVLVLLGVSAAVVWVDLDILRLGPARQMQRWVSSGEAKNTVNGSEYWVRQSYVYLPDSVRAPGRPPLPADSLLRRFVLVKNLKLLPLEKTCDSYVCPRGFEHSGFTYLWSFGDPRDHRVLQTVKLFVDGYAIWGLKEVGGVD